MPETARRSCFDLYFRLSPIPQPRRVSRLISISISRDQTPRSNYAPKMERSRTNGDDPPNSEGTFDRRCRDSTTPRDSSIIGLLRFFLSVNRFIFRQTRETHFRSPLLSLSSSFRFNFCLCRPYTKTIIIPIAI